MHGMTRDDDLDRLAAEHVLGLLDGEECARADRLLATDAVFVQAVARWRERLAELDETPTPRAAG
jgi:anti-sigma-K factor RskA